MATKTTNYNLTKPDLEDFADIRVLNNNLDIIDDALKKVKDTAENIDLSGYATKLELNNYLPLVGGNLTGPLTINSENVVVDKSTTIGSFSGYTKLSNGLIMQWGYFVVDTDSDGALKHITFDVPMPNNNYIIFFSRSGHLDKTPGYWSGVGGMTYNQTTTGFDITCQRKIYCPAVPWFVIGG